MIQSKLIEVYTDLCGSKFCNFSQDFISTNFGTELTKLIETHSGQKLRLVFDKQEPDSILTLIQTAVAKSGLKAKFESLVYPTNFFRTTKDDLEKKVFTETILDWEQYRANFVITEVTTQSLDYLVVFKDFLVSSFAVCRDKSKPEFAKVNPKRKDQIINQFDANFGQRNQKTFCISSKTGKIVGFFSLFNVFKETQLANVAGMTSLEFGYKDSSKLPILCAAILNEFYINEFFASSKSLSFSNSKAPIAQKYKDLGFEVDLGRKCVVVKCH